MSEKTVDFAKLKLIKVTDYFDRADVESLLSRYHPLGEKRAIGRRMSYAASYRGEWLGVVIFDIPVKKNKLREERVGWGKQQRDNRIQHIANNSRFLIIPEYAGVKNLASKILSMATDRISDDWFKDYGIPLLAVETYVDPTHNDNQGTCYLASGWERLGYSTGYQTKGEERTHSKWYFLKMLHKDSAAALSAEIPHALLTGVKSVSAESNNNYVLDASRVKLQDLKNDLAQIPDPRGKQGQSYKFVPFLSACICAVISGHTQYRQIADWIKKLPATERVRFGLPGNKTPHETAVSYLLSKIDPTILQSVLSTWLLKTYKKDVSFETISADGKAVRATSSDPKEQKGFLNVFANQLGIVIDHIPTKKGSGEKAAIRAYVDSQDTLEGKVIIADAIHTDRELIKGLEKKRFVCPHGQE
jgi:hypothetical protein